MHILLTDLLTCPRCGPDFGLIVLADRLEDRQVMEGRLGCANCRQSYPVHGGVADLRHPLVPALEVRDDAGSGDGASPEVELAERAMRVAAALGVTQANAPLLVVEPAGEVAGEISRILPEIHVLGLTPEPAREADVAGPGILSRLTAGGGLPVRSRSLRGVALLGIKEDGLLDDISRVLIPGSRLVIEPAAPGVAERVAHAGFTVLLEQEGVVVAALQGPG